VVEAVGVATGAVFRTWTDLPSARRGPKSPGRTIRSSWRFANSPQGGREGEGSAGATSKAVLERAPAQGNAGPAP